jgi:hypothetical protein
MEGIINWISYWFASQCDGDWEHENMLKIETVSNPGWYITIDLNYTGLEGLDLDVGTIEISEDDWYFYRIKNAKYQASGDLTKLEFLLNKFRELVESREGQG